jgi:hypothetical protein
MALDSHLSIISADGRKRVRLSALSSQSVTAYGTPSTGA